MNITSKLPATGTTIFTVMSALATAHNAVNLGQGFPDFAMDSELTHLVDKAMKDGYNQYVPMQGYAPLREALADKVRNLYGRSIDAGTDITITPGATYAIYTALTAALQPGDEVIVFEPAYDSYIPNIVVNGAIPVRIALQFPEYRINWNLVKEKINSKTRMIMINTPHNPTGAILTSDDMAQLADIVRNTNILILSDEVYEHLIFDGKKHESVLKYPELAERSFVSFSFGKVYHCTGWKLGYCIAPNNLMTEFRKIHQFNCFSCNTPMQVAFTSFLKNTSAYLNLGSEIQEMRDYFIDKMAGTRFTMLKSSGSYFICAKYDQISSENDFDFATRITKDFGVATIPVSSFYQDQDDNKVIRFCFTKKKETIDEAVSRLANV